MKIMKIYCEVIISIKIFNIILLNKVARDQNLPNLQGGVERGTGLSRKQYLNYFYCY